ncbi:Zn-ribbon domain-containing protein [Halobacterium salinarum]|uniref:Zn-ribbon domain-containing protein n=1 Tax=Halobacterium salinarum TaxID=2242 RepID=UPI001F1CE093|nr:Zn-ribbon domain-containing protein [Halobacterium salinarum]MCF2164323.1 Zn-ribbon domain-containing protein [Halobacterium salinarum]MCF2167110.1 Zn-ribbon domain-containing protein [Halobacterium salinarum]MCF2239664.1 Zn-ribbon domain-containing protein [Halobacterium salinarum]WJK63895.1 Zn-ribbon domain-containing protein [Halobacterium salinarum]
MPHQCTNCGHVFADGSKEMLSGCPDCGGNKFQYHPSEIPADSPSGDPTPSDGSDADSSTVSGAVGRAADRVRDAVAEADTPADDPTPDDEDDTQSDPAADSPGATAPDADPGVRAATPDDEDGAQATARSEVVDVSTLPDQPTDGRVVEEPDTDEAEPDLEDLREELNDQFESIRIVAPGQYELNLMELYDRQEYIIALQEDGQYVIEVPDAWEAADPTDVE